MSEKRALILFLKAPTPGRVKTRLQPQLTAQAAATLYRAMVEDLVAGLSKSEGWEFVVFFWPREEESAVGGWLGDGHTYRAQRGGDLGDRMLDAFAWARERGFDKTVIIGSDAPLLDDPAITEAFDGLDRADLVLGPSTDGGYYLIGMRAPREAIFEGVAWSTERVLSQTRAKARDAGITLLELEERSDVDTYEDVLRLWETLRPGGEKPVRAPRTARALGTILEGTQRGDEAAPRESPRGDHLAQAAPRGLRRLLLPAVIAAAAVLLFHLTPLSLSDVAPSRIKDFILGLGFWGPVVFVALYALRALVLVVPVGVMSLAGGLAYGRWWGTALIMAGAMLGSSLAFLVARYAGRRFIEQFRWLHRGRIKSFDEGTERHGLRIILTARLIPLFQYDAVNYGAGLSRMRFRDYALGSLIRSSACSRVGSSTRRSGVPSRTCDRYSSSSHSRRSSSWR